MSHCHAPRESSTPCATCAGTGARAAADGFETCPACRGAGGHVAHGDACCAAHDASNAASSSSSSSSYDVMRAVRALRLVDARDVERAFTEADDVAALYFTSKDCGACKRFAPTLMAFSRAHPDVRVVAIACDASSTSYDGLEGSNFTRVRLRDDDDEDAEDATRVSELNALLRALSIRLLPTVVVVNLKLNAVITDWGRTVLSLNSDPVSAWRRGESGLMPSPMRTFMKGIEQCAYGGDSSAA